MPSISEIGQNLIVGIWSSPTAWKKEVEEYIKDTGFDPYPYGTTEEKIQGDADFYGYDPNSELTLKEQYSYEEVLKFSQPDLLKQAIDKFADIRQTIDFGGNLDKSKLQFTSIPQGVFNFGLASKGLFRPIEYFSEKEGKVIPPEKVNKTYFKDLVSFNYLNENEEELPLRIQQEGTYLVMKNCKGVEVKYDKTAKMFLPFKDEKIFIGCGTKDAETGKKSQLRFATTTKKVYMYRKKVGGGLQPYVDLFVEGVAAYWYDTELMLIKNLPIFIISQFLNDAGIKTRIYNMASFSTYAGGMKYAQYGFVIKDYGESLDMNQVASFTSDKRFFRVNLWNDIPTLTKKRYGTALSIRDGYMIADNLQLSQMFTMFKNWTQNSPEDAVNTSKVSDPRLFINGTPGMFKQNMRFDQDETIEAITDEIYRIGDYVSLMFTKTPEKTLATIRDREMERQKGADKNEYIKKYLINAVTNNLLTIKNSSIPEVYNTPQRVYDEIEEQRITLLESINKIFKI